MNIAYSRSRRLAAATLFALVGAAALAPQAIAQVDNVKPPAETYGKYPCVVQCQITAHVSGPDANEPVTFSVNGKEIGTATPKPENGDKGKLTASIEWAAPSNGDFVITASQGADKKSKSTTYTVNVDVSETSKKK
ncbi:Ig-like domain-containing protein [Nocardia sp. NBC_01503]|uniref:Ig-like domain-containing protein n=1 Tax=Nocardia sp. NBC_01503 TaxID=2975997 RepID=UPI002E7B4D33|nr:Ig-like domain-containing protein [Nocardia sp. NBC_01503]WTL29135.1 Ig-like domain-containing protein [Nocardia sp. NBC_01503]